MSIYNLFNKCRVFRILGVILFTVIIPLTVFARGGCFLGDTQVLTPTGDKPIGQLRSGDSIISFNALTKKQETSQIQNVVVYQADSYFLINKTTKVTATHPFYVNRAGQLNIVEVKDLKVGDQLVSDNNQSIPITTIEFINTPASVFNLEDVTPNNSYFANGLLVHNKGGGGCFLPDSKIQTPDGVKSISSLQSGDSVISWDETTKQRKISNIGRIDVFEVDDYFVINNEIQVTGTHPFYVIGSDGQTTIKAVSTLKIGDRLTNAENIIPIVSIDHLQKPATVYNLVNVEPYNNYFADGVLVHNKGGSSSHSSSSSSHSSGSYKATPFVYAGLSYANFSACSAIADSAGQKLCQDHFATNYFFPSLGIIFFILMLIYNSASKAKTYSLIGKTFTTDPELIDYIKKIIPSYKNIYSSSYSSDTENWSPMIAPPEVSPALYQNLASHDILLDEIQKLYERYESDWTNKNFEGMKSYMKEPYYSKQKQIFDSSFGSNFDITYKPLILSATPLKVDLKIDGEYVKLQINGQMIDFEVSSRGTVISGVPGVRSFTEYWNVFIDLDKNFYLIDIEN